VRGLIATIKTAILLTIGENPGVLAKSLLTFIVSFDSLLRQSNSPHR